MFPKSNRLPGRAAKHVSRRGRAVSGPSLRIKWVSARGDVSKAAVVSSLSFDKRATKRNRVKRQVREALRPLLARLRPPLNLMVYVGKSAAGHNFKELREELVQLLKRARIL